MPAGGPRRTPGRSAGGARSRAGRRSGRRGRPSSARRPARRRRRRGPSRRRRCAPAVQAPTAAITVDAAADPAARCHRHRPPKPASHTAKTPTRAATPNAAPARPALSDISATGGRCRAVAGHAGGSTGRARSSPARREAARAARGPSHGWGIVFCWRRDRADGAPTRRALLVLGAAALVSACAPASAGQPSARPSRTSRRPVTASAAVRRRCEPPASGELRGGTPQQHVPCGGGRRGPHDRRRPGSDVDAPGAGPVGVARRPRHVLRDRPPGRRAPPARGRRRRRRTRRANHTYTHRLLPAATPWRIHEEIRRATDAIGAATGGVRPRFFRAPVGHGHVRSSPSAPRKVCARSTGRWIPGTGPGRGPARSCRPS